MKPMKELCSIDLSFFCEIKDAEMYGGEGSVGYSSTKMEQCDPDTLIEILSSPEKQEDVMKGQRNIIASALGIPIDNVHLITQAEYQIETDDDGVGDDEDWDDDDE